MKKVLCLLTCIVLRTHGCFPPTATVGSDPGLDTHDFDMLDNLILNFDQNSYATKFKIGYEEICEQADGACTVFQQSIAAFQFEFDGSIIPYEGVTILRLASIQDISVSETDFVDEVIVYKKTQTGTECVYISASECPQREIITGITFHTSLGSSGSFGDVTSAGLEQSDPFLFTTEYPLVGIYGNIDVKNANSYLGFYTFQTACSCEISDVIAYPVPTEEYDIYINSFDSAYSATFSVEQWNHSYYLNGFGDCLPLSADGQQIEYSFSYRDTDTGSYIDDPDFISRSGNDVTVVPPSASYPSGKYDVRHTGCLSAVSTQCAYTDFTVYIFEFKTSSDQTTEVNYIYGETQVDFTPICEVNPTFDSYSPVLATTIEYSVHSIVVDSVTEADLPSYLSWDGSSLSIFEESDSFDLQTAVVTVRCGLSGDASTYFSNIDFVYTFNVEPYERLPPEQVILSPGLSIDSATGGLLIQWEEPYSMAAITEYLIETQDSTSTILEICTTDADADIVANLQCIEPMQTFTDSLGFVAGDTIHIRVAAISIIDTSATTTETVTGDYSSVEVISVRSVPTDPRYPYNDSSLTGSTQIGIFWIDLTDSQSGYSTITSYGLEWDSGTTQTTWTQLRGFDTPDLTLTHLINTGISGGLSYSFRLQAENIYGWSEYGSYVTIVAAGPPKVNGDPNNAPLITRDASDKFDIMIQIDWQNTMDDNADPLTSYDALEFVDSTGSLQELSECSTSGLNTICTFQEQVLRDTLGLAEGDEIQVQITATNSYGSTTSDLSSGEYVAEILTAPEQMDAITIEIDIDTTTDDDIYFKVQWAYPTDDGGDPVTLYNLSFRGADGTFYESTQDCLEADLISGVTSCLLQESQFRNLPYSLVTGDQLYGVIKAYNDFGWSVDSAINTVSTELSDIAGSPFQMDPPTITIDEFNNLEITWVAPFDNYDPLTEYRIRFATITGFFRENTAVCKGTDRNGNLVTQCSASSRFLYLSPWNYKAGDTLQIQVQAGNNYGLGLLSESGTIIMPEQIDDEVTQDDQNEELTELDEFNLLWGGYNYTVATCDDTNFDLSKNCILVPIPRPYYFLIATQGPQMVDRFITNQVTLSHQVQIGSQFDFEYTFTDYWDTTMQNLTISVDKKKAGAFLQTENDCKIVEVPDYDDERSLLKVRREECENLRLAVNTYGMSPDFAGTYFVDVFVGNEIYQNNTFTIEFELTHKRSSVEEVEPERTGVPISDVIVKAPIIFESPQLTKYNISQTGKLKLYFEEGQRKDIQEIQDELEGFNRLLQDLPFEQMLLDFYLDPPNQNQDFDIDMTYEVTSVNQDFIEVDLHFNCTECVSNGLSDILVVVGQMPNGEPFKEYLILPTQFDTEKFWYIEFIAYIVAGIGSVAILVAIINAFLDANIIRKIEHTTLQRILETWQFGLFMHFFNITIPANSLLFASKIMPVVNFDVTYGISKESLGKWDKQIFGREMQDSVVLNNNMNEFGYVSEAFLANTHFLFLLTCLIFSILLVTLIKRPFCMQRQSPFEIMLEILESVCLTNFLIAALIQLRLGAPTEILDFQNFIAFPIATFYFLILPVIKVVKFYYKKQIPHSKWHSTCKFIQSFSRTLLALTIVIFPQWPVVQLIVTATILLYNCLVYMIFDRSSFTSMVSHLSLPLLFIAIVFDRQGYSNILFLGFMVVSHSIYLIFIDSRVRTQDRVRLRKERDHNIKIWQAKMATQKFQREQALKKMAANQSDARLMVKSETKVITDISETNEIPIDSEMGLKQYEMADKLPWENSEQKPLEIIKTPFFQEEIKEDVTNINSGGDLTSLGGNEIVIEKDGEIIQTFKIAGDVKDLQLNEQNELELDIVLNSGNGTPRSKILEQRLDPYSEIGFGEQLASENTPRDNNDFSYRKITSLPMTPKPENATPAWRNNIRSEPDSPREGDPNLRKSSKPSIEFYDDDQLVFNFPKNQARRDTRSLRPVSAVQEGSPDHLKLPNSSDNLTRIDATSEIGLNSNKSAFPLPQHYNLVEPALSSSKQSQFPPNQSSSYPIKYDDDSRRNFNVSHPNAGNTSQSSTYMVDQLNTKKGATFTNWPKGPSKTKIIKQSGQVQFETGSLQKGRNHTLNH